MRAGHRRADRHPGPDVGPPPKPLHGSEAGPADGQDRPPTATTKDRPRHPEPAGRHGRPRSRDQGSVAAARVRRTGPFELTEFGDGTPKRVDWKTRAALEEAERLLGYRSRSSRAPTTTAGSRPRAGTHDGGGVVDLLAWDWQRKVKVLRDVGFAAWYRPARPGLWGEHIHAVLIEHGQARPRVRRARSTRLPRGTRRAEEQPGRRLLAARARSRCSTTRRQAAAADAARRPRPRRDDGDRSAGAVPAPAAPSTASTPATTRADGSTSPRPRRPACAGGTSRPPRATSFTDATLPQARTSRPATAGIPVGAYHFARPDARRRRAGGRFFLDHTDIRAGDMLPMLDLEVTGGLTAGPADGVDGPLGAHGDPGAPPARAGRQADHLHAVQPRERLRLPAVGGALQRRLPRAGDPAALAAGGDLAALQRQVRAGQARARVRSGRRQRPAPRHPAVGPADQKVRTPAPPGTPGPTPGPGRTGRPCRLRWSRPGDAPVSRTPTRPMSGAGRTSRPSRAGRRTRCPRAGRRSRCSRTGRRTGPGRTCRPPDRPAPDAPPRPT